MGRLPTYDKEATIAKVLQGLRQGIPLTEVCSAPGMPSTSRVGQWEAADPAIAKAIASARAHGFDAIAARLRRTARGYGRELGGDSTGDVKRDRLIVDTDLKLLAKWDPRRYGEGFQLRMADADGNKIDTSPKFMEALAVLRLAGATPVQIVDAEAVESPAPTLPRPIQDISDLL